MEMVDFKDTSIIWTPLYRISDYTDIGCPPNKDANYTPYLLYSFKNWIYYYMRKKIGQEFSIDFKELHRDNKLYLTINFTIDDEIIKLTDEFYDYLTNKINNIKVPDLRWIPIFYLDQEIYTHDGCKLPILWLNQILRYINIDDSYDSYINDIGLMADIHNYPNYIDLHVQLTLDIKNKLIEYYKKGCILLPQETLIKDWNLISKDNNDLYICEWSGERIINKYKYMTDFLISRFKGEQRIYPKFPNDFKLRHILTIKLNNEGLTDYIYIPDGIDIKIENYNQALLIINLIDEILMNEESGGSNIEFMMVKNIEELDTLDINIIDGITYRTNDNERPYTWSRLIS